MSPGTSVAKIFLQTVLSSNRLNADAWYMLGEAQRGGGEFDQALASYHRAVRLVPNFMEVYRGMADVFEETGKTGEQEYAKGMIALVARSFDEAIIKLSEATSIVPDMAEAHEGLGVALHAVARAEEALESYSRAFELDETLFLARLRVRQLNEER